MSGPLPLEEEKSSARKQIPANQVTVTTYTSQPTITDLVSAKSVPPPPSPPPQEVRRQNVAFYLLRMLCRCFADYSPPDPTVPIPRMLNSKPLLEEQKPHQVGKKTLVVDLDETLVHSSFELIPKADVKINLHLKGKSLSLYVKYRPGAKEFLVRMSELYEIVIFTASAEEYASPVVQLLDDRKVVAKKLYRESCTLNRGFYVKDLGRLGRNLKDVVIIDNSEQSYMFHTMNAILIKSFFDDPSDQELMLMMPFLEQLATVHDVRPVETRKSEFEAEYLKRMMLVSEQDEEDQGDIVLPSFHQSVHSQKREVSILETSELHIPMDPPKVSTRNEEEMSIHQSIPQSSIPPSVNRFGTGMDQSSQMHNRSNNEPSTPLHPKSNMEPPSPSYCKSVMEQPSPVQFKSSLEQPSPVHLEIKHVKSQKSISKNSALNSPRNGQNEQAPRGWRALFAQSDRYIVDTIEVIDNRTSKTQPDSSLSYQESMPGDIIKEIRREEHASHMAGPRTPNLGKQEHSRSVSGHQVTPVIVNSVPEMVKPERHDFDEATPVTPDVIGLVFNK